MLISCGEVAGFPAARRIPLNAGSLGGASPADPPRAIRRGFLTGVCDASRVVE